MLLVRLLATIGMLILPLYFSVWLIMNAFVASNEREALFFLVSGSLLAILTLVLHTWFICQE